MDHVEFAAHFTSISFWDNDDFTELAHDVSIVDLSDRFVSFNFLVKRKIFVLFTYHERLNHFWFFLLFLFVWFLILTSVILDVSTFWCFFVALLKLAVLVGSFSVSKLSFGIGYFILMLLFRRFCHFSIFVFN